MASGLGLWLCLELRVRVCPTAAILVCAQFVLMGKLLWDSSSAEKPCMVVGTETGDIACPPSSSSLVCC